MRQTFPIGDQAIEPDYKRQTNNRQNSGRQRKSLECKGRSTRDDLVGKGEVGLAGVEMTGELVKGKRLANKENVVLEIV